MPEGVEVDGEASNGDRHSPEPTMTKPMVTGRPKRTQRAPIRYQDYVMHQCIEGQKPALWQTKIRTLLEILP